MKLAVPFAVLLGLLVTTLATAQPEPRERPARPPLNPLFTLPGVEWNEAQRAQIDDLRSKYGSKFTVLNRRRGAIETREQRLAMRKAQEEGRKAGKEGRELRAAVDEAVKLTAEQTKQLTDLQAEQRALVEEVQKELRSLLTAEQQQATQATPPREARTRGPAERPTHPNVSYGPHARNVMDVWLAKSEMPTPVLVSIHGGGFRGGNKGIEAGLLRECLDSGISVVAITYRLSDVAIAPAQFHDAARAVQFVRSRADEWNLDPTRFAATGGSAGAGLSLWLGFHDDLADPESDDPVLRESTRLTCMAVYNGQTSYDPRFIRELFPGTDTYRHQALALLYDVDLSKLDDLPAEKYRLFEEVSALPHLGKGDAPALLLYGAKLDSAINNQGAGIHHPKFGKVLEERMQTLGIECVVHTGVQRNDDAFTRLTMDFVKKHFGLKSPSN